MNKNRQRRHQFYYERLKREKLSYEKFKQAAKALSINLVKQHEAESEVREKIYQQEMDKIRFCGCGCILPDCLTQCSDCEALDD